MLWFIYLFNFLDRNALINARLNNLEKDLGLKGTQYNTCVSILFVGYMYVTARRHVSLTLSPNLIVQCRTDPKQYGHQQGEAFLVHRWVLYSLVDRQPFDFLGQRLQQHGRPSLLVGRHRGSGKKLAAFTR